VRHHCFRGAFVVDEAWFVRGSVAVNVTLEFSGGGKTNFLSDVKEP
jgi:hypothetical protein